MAEKEFLLKLYLLGFKSLDRKLVGMEHRVYFRGLTVVIYTNGLIRYTFKGLFILPLNKDRKLILSATLKKLKEIT